MSVMRMVIASSEKRNIMYDGAAAKTREKNIISDAAKCGDELAMNVARKSAVLLKMHESGRRSKES